MKFGYRVLLISPESWSHIHVSKHHYAIELANQGSKVFFLNPPSDHYQLTRSAFENLFVLDYKGFIKGLHFLPAFVRLWEQRRVLNQLFELAGGKFDVVWSFDNSVFYDFAVFGTDTLKISHIVDLNQNFQTARAAKSADICFGVITRIVERLKQYNANAYLIGHGVHIHPCEQQVTLPGRNELKALYFGNLSMPHLDWELLGEAVLRFPNLDFILLGSNGEQAANRFSSNSNVYVLPPVSSEILSCYMAASDILLLFYTPEYYDNFASPHKLMEYLSSGKTIVASYTEDHSNHADLMMMARSKVEWLDLLDAAIGNLDKLSNADLAERRKEVAIESCYENQILKIKSHFSGLQTQE